MAEVALVQEPGFITYLMNPDLKHDCYFVVQTPNSDRPERIGVVKKMLLAHSVVLRAELEESKLAEKGDIHVEDLFADTVRNLLKYVYGHDNVASLCFDAADNLLYAAEKYMMKPLKDKLAERLMSMLNTENICSLLNNPACFSHLELQSTVTKILQFETLKVLDCPRFLDLSSDAFLTILKQDSLAVQEIEIWRAALKWAKHNAVCKDKPKLRKQMSNQLKHIRFCTLTLEDVCKEVMPTGVLTYPEIQTVCSYICNKEPQPQLTSICDKTEPRSTPDSNKTEPRSTPDSNKTAPRSTPVSNKTAPRSTPDSNKTAPRSTPVSNKTAPKSRRVSNRTASKSRPVSDKINPWSIRSMPPVVSAIPEHPMNQQLDQLATRPHCPIDPMSRLYISPVVSAIPEHPMYQQLRLRYPNDHWSRPTNVVSVIPEHRMNRQLDPLETRPRYLIDDRSGPMNVVQYPLSQNIK